MHSWMKQLWKFLEEIGGLIRHVNVWTPIPKFSNDSNIMEAVAQWDISDAMKYKINACRLYKRCYFIGDLLDPTGVQFLPGALTLQTRLFHSDKFPSDEVPPGFTEVWQYAVRRLVQQKGIGTHLGHLQSVATHAWSLDSTKTILVQSHYNKRPTLHIQKDDLAYHKLPTSVNVPVKPFFGVQVREKHRFLEVATMREMKTSIQRTAKNSIFPKLSAKWSDSAETFLSYIDMIPEPYRLNI